MGLFSKLSISTDLVNGMANRLGSDLGNIVARDPENQGPKFRSMVVRCSSCSEQAGCAELQRACDHLDHAPDYCLNRETLDSVRAR